MDNLDRLPADVEIRLMSIQMAHINEEYDRLKELVIVHEVELAVLWAIAILLLVNTGIQIWKDWDDLKESEGR